MRCASSVASASSRSAVADAKQPTATREQLEAAFRDAGFVVDRKVKHTNLFHGDESVVGKNSFCVSQLTGGCFYVSMVPLAADAMRHRGIQGDICAWDANGGRHKFYLCNSSIVCAELASCVKAVIVALAQPPSANSFTTANHGLLGSLDSLEAAFAPHGGVAHRAGSGEFSNICFSGEDTSTNHIHLVKKDKSQEAADFGLAVTEECHLQLQQTLTAAGLKFDGPHRRSRYSSRRHRGHFYWLDHSLTARDGFRVAEAVRTAVTASPQWRPRTAGQKRPAPCSNEELTIRAPRSEASAFPPAAAAPAPAVAAMSAPAREPTTCVAAVSVQVVAPEAVECTMCLEPLERRYMLPDCGHTRTCLKCIDAIVREHTELERKCPECRALMKANPLRVYL